MTADPISSALLNESITIAPGTIAEERLMFQWDFSSLLRIANEFKKADIAAPKDVSAMWGSGTVEKRQPKWHLSKPSAYPREVPHRDQVQGGVTAEQLAAAKDDHGWTALHYVAAYGHLAQIRGEVKIGQLLGVKSNDGTSAFDAAVEGGQLGQAFGPEPLGAWLELHAYEQQLVRDALKEKRIPEKIARVIGICCNADDPPAWM